MSQLVYIQKHIFDLDCQRVYPILGYKEIFVMADEATFCDGDFIYERKQLDHLISIGDVFATSDLTSAISLAKNAAKMWNTISNLEDK